MSITSCVYLLTNSISGKQYIGQSWDVESRWAKGYDKYTIIHNAIKKHGWRTFHKDILMHCDTQEELDFYEALFIKMFDTLKPNGYNNKHGGRSGRHTDETVAKMAAIHTGKKQTPERAAKSRVANLGRRYTRDPSVGRKISAKLKGRSISDSHKAKIGASTAIRQKGRIIKWKDKIGDAMRGRPWSPARRAAYERSKHHVE